MAGLEIVRHSGASFVVGRDMIHLFGETEDTSALIQRWQHRLVDSGLAEPLGIRQLTGGGLHAHASCYPFLPLSLVRKVVEASNFSAAEESALDGSLASYCFDADNYCQTFSLHRRLATSRGWPAWPLMLGSMPSLVIGAGCQHILFSMNLAPTASAMIGLAGFNKGVGRDLLAAYGLAVAPGAMVMTVEAAVSQASHLGWPVVLKRLSGGNSDGVIAGLRDEDSCRQAAVELLKGNPFIIVEKHVEGIELRVHFVAGKIEQVLFRDPDTVVGDGISSLRELMTPRHKVFLELAGQTRWSQQQLIYRFWSLGLRSFSDIDVLIPACGQEVVLGKSFASTSPLGKKLTRKWLHPADRQRLESFLAGFGRPSGALDVILARPGAPLADNGAVLDLNVPSGTWYLDGKMQVAARELDAWIADRPNFKRTKGRVPFWLAGGQPSRSGTSVEAAFRRHYPQGAVVRLSDIESWVQALTASAEALLVFVTEDDVRKHGLPLNLGATVWFEHSRSSFGENYPLFEATLQNCGKGSRFRCIQ